MSHTDTSATAKKDPLGSGWIIVAAVCFTVMGVLVKAAGRRFAMSHYELVFWRVMVAVLVLGLQAALFKRSLKTPHLKAHIGRGLTGTAGLVLFFYGITHLPLATAITLNYTSAVFLALLSVLVYRERPPLRIWLALLAGLGGIALILRPAFHSGQEWAALVGLGSGFCAGAAYLQVRGLSRMGEPTWRVVWYFSAVAAVVSAILASRAGWHRPSLESLPYVAGIGLSAMFAQLALTRAYQVGRTFTVAALSYLTVVFSALYGALWLGEALGGQEAAGIAIIVTAGVASSLKK